jgi:hypothetical protein
MYKLNSKLLFQGFLLVGIVLISFSCKKESTKNETTAELNTWTFTEGSTTFEGKLLLDANLTTDPSPNNSYTFGILGFENTSGDVFNVVLSLLDTTFAVKSYQSGIDGNEDYLNAFHYGPAASIDAVYQSSNLDPGPVMTYTVTSYDAGKDIITITFSGAAQKDNGSMVDITKGRITAHIAR